MRLAKCPYNVSTQTQMDDFDDLSVEEFSTFDFVEEMNEGLFEEEEDNKKSFDTYLNSNYDY
jgi:hypothetical protein